MYYFSFLSHNPLAFQSNLARMLSFKRGEIQAELWVTQQNTAGETFLPGGQAPGPYLEAKGLWMAGYLRVTWITSYTETGSSGGHERETTPLWLKRDIAKAVQDNNWWLRDKAGKQVLPKNEPGTMVADITNPDYRAWLLDYLVPLPIQRLRFDNGFMHPNSYYTTTPVRSVPEMQAGACALYDNLRAAGKEVYVNNGWEMFDPNFSPWQFPLGGHVDGVMVEWPTGFRAPSTSRWWRLSEQDFINRLAPEWHAMGAKVILFSAYNSVGDLKSDYPDLGTHARRFRDIAADVGCWLFVGNDDGAASATGEVYLHDRPDLPDPYAEDNTPVPDPDSLPLTARMKNLEGEVAALRSVVAALQARL